MVNALAINMYRYWQAQNGIKTGFFGILRRKFRRVLTVLPKFENLRSGGCPSGGEAFIIRFTSRRKEVKPLTEGGRAVLVLFVTASAASDLRRGRIYNFLTFPTLAAGLLLLIVNKPQEIPQVLGAAAAALLLLFPFWKAGGGSRRYQTAHGTGSADGASVVSLRYCSFFSDRRGNLRVSADQIPGFIPNCSLCCANRHQRHALSASRAAWNTEPIPGNVLIFAGYATGRPAGFILMRPQEIYARCVIPDERRAPND